MKATKIIFSSWCTVNNSRPLPWFRLSFPGGRRLQSISLDFFHESFHLLCILSNLRGGKESIRHQFAAFLWPDFPKHKPQTISRCGASLLSTSSLFCSPVMINPKLSFYDFTVCSKIIAWLVINVAINFRPSTACNFYNWFLQQAI